MRNTKSFLLGLMGLVVLTMSLAACKKKEESAESGTKELSSRAKAQKDVVYEIIDKYFEEKGVEKVEKSLEAIIEKRRRGPSMEERMAKRVNVDIAGAPIKGEANAPITIVEFSDFSCPFCVRVNPTLDQVFKEYSGKVKLAFRHKPLPIHPAAPAIHIASMAAQEQGKFWEYHDRAFKGQDEVKKEADKRFGKKKPASREEMEKVMNEIGMEIAKKWAKDVGLDMAKFEQDVKRPEFRQRLEADIKFADENGPGGTPSFYINGVSVVGAVPFQEFKQVIDTLLAEKK